MITVLEPGLLTTVQDAGRRGHRAFGVPLAGAMDRYAYAVANILSANPAGAAALEMTYLGGSYRFEREALISLCGADMEAQLDGQSVSAWSSVRVRAGGELTVGPAATGCRTYLAVNGGIDVPPVLGSRSTYTRAAMGGFCGRALREGDVLPMTPDAAAPVGGWRLPDRFVPRYGNEVRLRLMLGPQDDLFTDEGLATLFSSTYQVTDRNDRMGYQLEGPQVPHQKGADIVSDALCPGAVQVTGRAVPIVMTADCQTTGGYTKVGVVIGPDLAKLTQTGSGCTVRFIRCSDAEAVEALRAEREALREVAARFSAEAASQKRSV